MTAPYSQRRSRLLRELKARKLDALLVTHPPNWFYLSGFTGESGALLVSSDATVLITDGRFTVQAKDETRGVRIALQAGALFPAIGAYLKGRGLRRVGFDANQLSVAQLQALKKAAGSQWRGQQASGLVERLRMKKDAQELAVMRKAAILAGEVLKSALPLIKPGVREREVAAEIEYQMKRRGASGPSFETIVASGPRGALPHARPSSKKLRKNELVVLDLGAILAHYCSDMTRTVHLGRASQRVRDYYRSVQSAQEAAVAAVKPGATCGDVDAAARDVLRKNRLDKYFVHSTGHGLGLEVHEDPRVARGQPVSLEPGNVITIEPGIYLEGVGGIRIEDDVLVAAGRGEVLTRVTRDLIEL
jgi:Xaa-Pro aminopeptidase